MRRDEDPCEGTASETGAEPMEMGGEWMKMTPRMTTGDGPGRKDEGMR